MQGSLMRMLRIDEETGANWAEPVNLAGTHYTAPAGPQATAEKLALHS